MFWTKIFFLDKKTITQKFYWPRVKYFLSEAEVSRIKQARSEYLLGGIFFSSKLVMGVFAGRNFLLKQTGDGSICWAEFSTQANW
jgi:hypothetical protein